MSQPLFRQTYSQISEKYKRLKEKFLFVVEKQPKMEGCQKAEHVVVDVKLQNGGQAQAGIKTGQSGDSSLSQHDAISETSLCKQSPLKDRKPESKEPINQRLTSEPTFKHCVNNSAFKPSNESAFRKLNVSADNASSVADKPAGPIPSQQATKCASVGLPRRVEQRKQSGGVQAIQNPPSEMASKPIASAMQPSNIVLRATKESTNIDKSRNAAFSRKNKENNLYNSGEKPDACKSQ